MKLDLILFQLIKNQVFMEYASDAELGVEDPRIIEIEGKYVMTYVSLVKKRKYFNFYCIFR